MKLDYRVLWQPKRGCSEEEYEDAFAPESVAEKDWKVFRCAIADGATETSFSGLWAKLLCQAYTQKSFELAELQSAWLAEVSGLELPWYAEQKLESGAYASILGLRLKEERRGVSWNVRAIGDCCMFQIRNSKILKALPLSNWEDFDYSPALLSTRKDANTGVLENEFQQRGNCRRGDLIYLMTDAMAKWFLRRSSESSDAVSILEEIADLEDFRQLLEKERSEKDQEGRVFMPNDDVSWIRIEIK